MKTLRFALDIVLSVALPLAVQLWDKRRLTQDQRARAWNYASWGSALYGFNVLSMLGWFWVTRRSALGLVWGLVSVAALGGAFVGLDYLLALTLGLPP